MTPARARLLSAVRACDLGPTYRAGLASLLAHESGVPGVVRAEGTTDVLSVRYARPPEGKRGMLVAELLRADGTSGGIVATEDGPIARRGARAGEELLLRVSVRLPAAVRTRLEKHGAFSALARRAIEELADRLDAASDPRRAKRAKRSPAHPE